MEIVIKNAFWFNVICAIILTAVFTVIALYTPNIIVYFLIVLLFISFLILLYIMEGLTEEGDKDE